MAKRFTETVQLQPQSLETGAAGGLMSLANRLEQFSRTTRAATKDLAKTVGTIEGKREGEAVELQTKIVDGQEVTVAPERREASLLDLMISEGAKANSYNKAVGTAYAASLSNDNREAFAAIETKHPDDMVAYNVAIEGYSKGVMEGVDPVLSSAVKQNLDKLATNGRIRVRERAITRQIEIADIERTEAIEKSSDAAVRLAQTGDYEAAQEALQEAQVVINSYVGQPGYDQAAADFAYKEIQKTVATEGVLSEVTRTAEQDGGIPKAVKMIRTYRDANLPNVTVEEQEATTAAMLSNLNQVIALKNKEEDREQINLTQLQKEKAGQLFIGVTVGATSAGDILNAIASNQINVTQGNMLIQVMNNRGSGVDDYQLINDIETRILNNEDEGSIIQEITANTGLRLTEATARGLIATVRDSKDQASPLTTSDSKAALTYIKNMTVKTGALGAIDFDAQKRMAGLNREFREAVLSGENPWIVADRLVNSSNELEEILFIYGDTSNTKAAMVELNQAATSGVIDEVTYNVQYDKIRRAEFLQQNLTSFTSAKKAALSRERDVE